jgi:predicted dehydrogenase
MVEVYTRRMPTAAGLIRVAFLGLDEQTEPLLRAVESTPRFQLAGICEFEVAGGADGPVAHRVRDFDSWESLLDEQQVDVVVVARGSDEDRRADQLRKLIQVGRPIVVSHPVVDSMLVYYELDMIRRDTNCLVIPYLRARVHPAIGHVIGLARKGSASPLGGIEQLSFERSMNRPTKADVVRQFARDVDVVRAVGGDMTHLGAMAAGSDETSYANLGVQMSGPAGVVARWSVDPNQPAHAGRLMVRGSRGKAMVDLAPAGQPWSMETTIDGKTEHRSFADWDPAAGILAALEAKLDGAPEVPPTWVDAARSVELAETIERSLHKARTIELHYEDYTEEGTFKGTMTSVGCGLLLVGLFLLGAVGIAEQMGLPYVKYWPHVLLGVLAVFLLLQMLMLAFRSDGSRDKAEPRNGS